MFAASARAAMWEESPSAARQKGTRAFMKKGKSALCWLLAAVLVVCLCACADEEGDHPDRDQPGTETVTENGQANPATEPSYDSEELKERAEQFAEAYFRRDADTIPAFLADSFDGEFRAVYPLDGTVTDFTVKGLDGMEDVSIGDVRTASVEFKDSEQDDSYLYLTIEFIKQEDGWKVQFYGLEK